MVKFELFGSLIELTLTPIELELAASFGTSHSSTTRRRNALTKLSVREDAEVVNGFGEAGLPPKRFGCYEGSIDDLCKCFDELSEYITSEQAAEQEDSDPFAELPSSLFAALRLGQHRWNPLFRRLFSLLDRFCQRLDQQHRTEWRPFKHAIEMCLLDAWCKVYRLPIYRAMGFQKYERQQLSFDNDSVSFMETGDFCKSFYTISMPACAYSHQDLTTVDEWIAVLDKDEELKQTIRTAETFTDLWKLKCNGNAQLLEALLVVLRSHFTAETRLAIDANCAWSVIVGFLGWLSHLQKCGTFSRLPQVGSRTSSSTDRHYPSLCTCTASVHDRTALSSLPVQAQQHPTRLE